MPITTTTVLAYLANLGAGVAANEVSVQLKKLLGSRHRQIAKKTAKAAKDEGISVSPAMLRQWLRRPDVQQQLVIGTHDSVETAVKRLALGLKGTEEERNASAVRIIEITCRQYLLVQSPQEAAAVAAAQTQAVISAENESTQKMNAEGFAAVISKLDAPGVFEENLSRFHPWRAEEARQLNASWARIQEVVDLIANSHDRRELLASWATSAPTVLDEAPGAAWCWIGQLARDYGYDYSWQLIVRGIERGVSDPDYWWARAALATGPTDDDGDSDGDSHGDSGKTRRDLLQRAVHSHALVTAQQALLDQDWPKADEALAGWEVNTPVDAVIRAFLRAESACAQGELDLAISILSDATVSEASGPKARLAELLLSRGYHGQPVNRIADFTRAQSLAIEARDSRRRWGGDSAQSVLIAIKASALANDLNRAWQFTQVEPAGNAIPAEAADPRILREAAVLAAMTSRIDEANRLAADLADPYTTELVAGYLAIGDGELAAAENHMNQAWTVAPNVISRLQIAQAMAHLGRGLPDLAAYEVDHGDLVDQIRAIHDVMKSSVGTRLTKLRAHAQEHEQIAVLLAQELSARGDFLEAAEVLDQAASRWDHPLLRKMAADSFLQSGEYERAADAARRARALAGASWPGELDCLGIEFNALEALGRDSDSLVVARQMTFLAPENDDARWALVNCLGRVGNLEGAFSALRREGVPIRPRHRNDARNWIILLTACDESPYYLSRALTELDRWSEDEEIAGVFLANITQGLARREGAPDEGQLRRLHAFTDTYVTKFPESQVFRRVAISEEDPLGDLAAVLKEHHSNPALQELREKVASAEIPLGVGAEILGVSYSESSLKRAAGFVYSHDARAREFERDDLLASIRTGPVVIDTTAAVSILAISPQLREFLIGQFTRLESTSAAFRDARIAQQSLSLRSTMSAYMDPRQEHPRIAEISQEQANMLAEQAEQLVALLTTTRRGEWKPRHFEDVRFEGPWINVLDYAVSNQLPFWCDDVVLRHLARQTGCTTFGTIEFIDALVAAGELDAETARAARAKFLVEFHARLDFDHELYVQAARMDSWRPQGVAAALTLPEVWRSSPHEVMRFVHEVAAENAEEAAHEELRGWVCAAGTGLARFAPDADGAAHNLSLLLGSFLAQPWMTPRHLPVVVDGVRHAMNQPSDAEDPLHKMFVMLYRLATEEYNHSVASYVLLHWVGHLSQADKHDATMIAARLRGPGFE